MWILRRATADIQKDVEDFFAAFPDIQFALTNTVVRGDLAALEGTATGTHRGRVETPNGTIPATDKTVTMGFAAFVQLDAEGRITEERRYYDVAGMLQQLGLMGQPAA
jgi:predicted ester cyclase